MEDDQSDSSWSLKKYLPKSAPEERYSQNRPNSHQGPNSHKGPNSHQGPNSRKGPNSHKGPNSREGPSTHQGPSRRPEERHPSFKDCENDLSESRLSLKNYLPKSGREEKHSQHRSSSHKGPRRTLGEIRPNSRENFTRTEKRPEERQPSFKDCENDLSESKLSLKNYIPKSAREEKHSQHRSSSHKGPRGTLGDIRPNGRENFTRKEKRPEERQPSFKDCENDLSESSLSLKNYLPKSGREEKHSQHRSSSHKGPSRTLGDIRPNGRENFTRKEKRPEERQPSFKDCENDLSESRLSRNNYLPKSAPEERHSQHRSYGHKGPSKTLGETRPTDQEDFIWKKKHDTQQRPRPRDHPLSRADALPRKATEQRSNQGVENSFPRRPTSPANNVKHSDAIGQRGSHNQRNLRRDRTSRNEEDNKSVADVASGKALALEKYQHKKSPLFNNTKQQPVDLQLLKTWAEMRDANKLVVLISSQMNQLELLLNQPTLQEDCLVSIITVVSNALNVHHQHEPIKQLLDRLCRTKFFDHLIMYTKEKQISNTAWDDLRQFLMACSKILSEILNKLPGFAKTCMTVASDLLDTARCTETLQGNMSLLADMASLYKKSKEVFLAERKFEQKTRGGIWMSNNLEEPPDNFVDLPITPTEMDLKEDANPFIRSITIEGGYTDVHQYLDVQFRLMREDFIIPLRKGLAEFKKNHSKKGFRSSHLRFYFNVRIVGAIFNKGLDHVLRVDDSKLQRIQRQNSKCLMFGSLLCLSKDNFKTVIFATVAHDVSRLDKGFIVVNVKTGLDYVSNSSSNDVYVMAESQAFFDSYCHVLEGLQEMITKLPLQDYIIHCKTELQPPRYLLPSGGICQLPIYDLSSLMKGKLCTVPVLTTVKWPNVDVMCLNESQRAAAQLALTKELAIIQGPPGTGKTYVGLKVMQVLLQNKHIRVGNDENSSDPILVVCYTNHALDQFLEGVLKFCPGGIVRVGGQSKSEQLKVFNLNEIRHRRRRENARKKRSYVYDSSRMEDVSSKISALHESMESLQMDIIKEYTIARYTRTIHLQSLLYERANIKTDDAKIHAWLTTSNQTTQSILSQMIKKHLTMLILKMKEEPKSEKLPQLFPRMNIMQRAHFYCYYLKWYQNKHELEMQQLSTKPATDYQTYRMHEIEYWLNTAQTHILPDHQLRMVLPEGVYETIWKCLPRPQSLCDSSDNVIETWLLRPDKSLHQRLDDVQMLTKVSSHKEDDHESWAPDYTFIKEQNDRMVDDDARYRRDVKACVRTAVNSLTSATQRAEALGIRDDVLLDDDVPHNEWETVTTSKLNLRAVHRKLRFIKPMTQDEENNVTSVWDLELDKRFALYNSWVQRYKLDLNEQMQELVREYKSEQEQQKKVDNQETLDILRKAKVIGMTTSGAARLRSVLQALGCRIIVVEEAAEVLESHIVTSLNENCKHLILIGDHQQLRPNPTVYQLAKDFGLEISLFERLIKNKVPHVMLKEQHRMRPQISEIMRHIYPDLQDHSSVANRENIRGVSKNIFFIQHEHQETQLEDSMSKANTHEAKFLVALCRYLLNQDYEPSQITILATYSGQVTEITKVMKEKHLDPTVLVTTVDNYQGEENDIILLSLVRSNTENQVGFLKVDNRVCVALSRARIGLYAIGNLQLLASHSKLWNKIVATATSNDTFDTRLGVHCQNHPDVREFMTSERDFQKCPEGGCGRPCLYRLTCGHVCEKMCHGYDRDHTVYKCPKPCPKTCGNGHACKQRCYEECVCTVLMLKQMSFCGHEDEVPCHVPAEEAVCSLSCSSVLDCGHQCSGICGQCTKNEKHKECPVEVQHQWTCGHTETVPCYTTKLSFRCKQVCGAKRDCGHKCPGICSQCTKNEKHKECPVEVQHRWTCGHTEIVPCYTTKLSFRCKQVCGAKRDCGHKCPGICGQCTKNEKHKECPVEVQHQWLCGHTETVPCYTTKLSYRCRQVCGAKRDCGHECPGICGQCKQQGKHNECHFKVQHKWPCGHNENVDCSTTKLSFRCRQVCGTKRDCGHECPGICGQCKQQGKHDECHIKVQHKWPCGHNETVDCYTTKLSFRCRQVCGATRDCGHECSGICGQCSKIGAHVTCKVPVGYQRPCGHTEEIPCGQGKPMNACQNVCEVDLYCGHQCAGICGRCKQEGGHRACKVPVGYQRPCGHTEEIPCCQEKPMNACQNVCGADLDCGHQCAGICDRCTKEGEHRTCELPVKYRRNCGHADETPCRAIPSPKLLCKHVCGAELKCGHICKGICSECLQGRVHQACPEQCALSLPCGHTCGGFCGAPCLPCAHLCPNQCKHGSCFQDKEPPLCSHACPPCMARCSYGCMHLKCSSLCSEKCDIKPCAKRCNKRMPSCHHECDGLCGELCVCGKCENVSTIPQSSETKKDACIDENAESSKIIKDVKNKATDNEIDKQRNEQHRSDNNQNERLLKLPSCGHIFYIGDLDTYVHRFDRNGSSYIPCPACQMPILNCIRYENINRMKSVHRSVQKEKLRRERGISEKQKADLQASQNALGRSPLMKDFHSIDVENAYNSVTLRAISFQLKCGFVLNTISSVMKNQDESAPTEILKSLKHAVLNIKGRLTKQQREEFTAELLRCFWLCCLSHLDSIKLPDGRKEPRDYNIDTELRDIIDALGESKVTHDILIRAEHVSGRKNKRIQKRSRVKEDRKRSLFLERASSNVLKTMASADEDMLCHLIERHFQDERPERDIGDLSAEA